MKTEAEAITGVDAPDRQRVAPRSGGACGGRASSRPQVSESFSRVSCQEMHKEYMG